MFGQGSVIFADGTQYEGEWINGVRQGKGVLKISNGLIYEGNFSANLFHGKGKMIYPDGSLFEGEFYKGKKNGRGILKFSDGLIFDGTFKADFFKMPDGDLI